MTTIAFASRGPARWQQAGFALALAVALPAFAGTFPGLSLRVPNEAAPPGGSVQLKVLVTEPKPIIIGLTQIAFGDALGPVLGILLPATPDAAGAAVIRGHQVAIRLVSPSGTLGLSPEPAVVVTIAVPDLAPVGFSKSPLVLDPAASSFIDPSGQLYPQQVKQGAFIAAGVVSINDVLPGGGFLLAGSLITIAGIGFQPGALAEIDGVGIASVTWVSPTRVDVVTATDAQLDGKRVSVRNPDGTRAGYFSYLRAAALGTSARPLLAATEAIYPVQPLSSGFFAAPPPAAGTFLGVAMQNPNATPATISVELRAAGSVVASSLLTLPPRSEIVREASELLTGVIPQAGTILRVTASVPVQMLGLAGNDNDGSVAPLLPALTAP